MAIELTSKYADKIDERYYPQSVSSYGTNQNYDWDGAKTIKVTSVGTVAMKDYDRTVGYGAVAGADDLANAVQTLTLTKDRFFRFKLDKMDENESKIKAGEALGRQLREVTMPEIEAQRFLAMCSNIGGTGKEIVYNADAYLTFLDANETLDDLNIPESTRVAYCTPGYLKSLKKSDSFIKAGDLSQSILIKGQIGEVDGVPIVKINKNWLAGTTLGVQEYDCIIVDKNATVAPLKLAEFEVFKHQDFSGLVGQGRFYYDTFVLDMKKNGMVGVLISV